jgi:hypothetical protein
LGAAQFTSELSGGTGLTALCPGGRVGAAIVAVKIGKMQQKQGFFAACYSKYLVLQRFMVNI